MKIRMKNKRTKQNSLMSSNHVGVSEERSKKIFKGQKIFKEIMVRQIPNFMKDINPQI